MDTYECIESLRSAICPACGMAKKPTHSLCGSCYRALPRKLRRDLYAPVGHGYESAMNRVLKRGGVFYPHLPQNGE